MKKILLLLLISISISGFSQQLIRGYTTSFSYGILAVGDSLTINYENNTYQAEARNGTSYIINFGFPFDFGYKRSRITIVPGLDIMQSDYFLDINPIIPRYGANSDSLRLNSFMITPTIGAMYKLHFYVSKLHLAISLGADFKLPIINTIVLKDKNKSDFIEYKETNLESDDAIIFNPNTVFSNLSTLGFHINPKAGLDVYLSKFLVTHLFVSMSPLTYYTKNPAIRGYAGFGISYLVPFKRENDLKFLQYYKK